MSNHAFVAILGVSFSILAAAFTAYFVRKQAMQNTPHTRERPEEPINVRIQRPAIFNSHCFCEEIIRPNQEVEMIHCGHRFHTYCIRRWLEESDICPSCKQPA